MNRRNRAFPGFVFDQRYNRPSGLCSGPDFCKKFALRSLPFTIFLLIGAFMFTMVFNSQESGSSPESKNRRMICQIILAIIGFINLCLIVTTAYICIQRKNNARQGITRPNTGQIRSTTQGGSGNVTTTTQYPSPYGFQQPAYGQTPMYPPGSYPPPVLPAGHSTYPTAPAYPSSTQYPFNSPYNIQAPYPTEMPPPPSYESTVGQSDTAPSAPPAEKVEA